MKKIIFFIFYVLLFFCSHAQGPGFHSVKQMGGPNGNSIGVTLTNDASGNVYVAGYFFGTIDFDPGLATFTLASVGVNSDVFITKLDAAGNFIWARSIGGTSDEHCNSIVVDALENAYITGDFSGTADFDPSIGTSSLTSNGGQDIYVLKLDALGNFVWAKNVGGISNDNGNGLSLDSFDNVYVTGGFQGSVDFDPDAGMFNINSLGFWDIFILKLDNNGDFVWAKNMSGSGSESAAAITLDPTGNIYGTGTYGGSVDFDPGAGVFNLNATSSTFDIFVFKLDASGNFAWAKSMGGSDNDFSNSITFSMGHVYTAGGFRGIGDFDPGPGVYNLNSSLGISSVFISKLDASGNFVWAKAMGGTQDATAYSMDHDASGNIYTIGNFKGTADFDPGAGTFNLSTAFGVESFFISKLNSSGNYVWAGAIGGTNSDYGACLKIDASDNLYATGSFVGNIDFDPDAGIYTLTSLPKTSAFILKMSPCCAGINELDKNTQNVLPYPNPNNGIFNLNIDDDIESGELILFNMLGQIVYEQKIIKGHNQINTTALAKGIYNCRLIANKQKIEIGKLAVE